MALYNEVSGALASVPIISGTLSSMITIRGELGLPYGVSRSCLVDSNGNQIIDSKGNQLTTKEIFRGV